ncbi:MAG: PaaI family thioesterase [Candidatus Heteroscillospira sp.]|jgi:acyl-coenzyme A thioesterase PaaI-like protein
MTHAEFKEKLEDIVSPERWGAMPMVCAELRPQLISCDQDKLELVLAFDTKDWMGNPVRWLHGGIMAIMFDNGMFVLPYYFAGGVFTPTVTMDINYLRPAPLVGRVYMHVRVIKPGRSLVHVHAEISPDTGFTKPYASATAIFAIPREAQK